MAPSWQLQEAMIEAFRKAPCSRPVSPKQTPPGGSYTPAIQRDSIIYIINI